MTKTIKIFFYNPRFPKRGWIQQCICCNLPTSELEDTGNNDNYHFVSYVCLSCKRRKYKGNKETIRYFYDITNRFVTIFSMDK